MTSNSSILWRREIIAKRKVACSYSQRQFPYVRAAISLEQQRRCSSQTHNRKRGESSGSAKRYVPPKEWSQIPRKKALSRKSCGSFHRSQSRIILMVLQLALHANRAIATVILSTSNYGQIRLPSIKTTSIRFGRFGSFGSFGFFTRFVFRHGLSIFPTSLFRLTSFFFSFQGFLFGLGSCTVVNFCRWQETFSTYLLRAVYKAGRQP